jgi:bacterioferritin
MNNEKIIKKLNQALERELAEVVKYMHQSFWVQGPKRKKMVGFFREQSQESMGHAILLGEKIVDMGGTPVVKILEIYEPKPHNIKEILLECVEDERKAMEGYQQMLPLVETDKELHKMIKGLAKEEAEHMAEIEAMAKKS